MIFKKSKFRFTNNFNDKWKLIFIELFFFDIILLSTFLLNWMLVTSINNLYDKTFT